MYIHRYLAEVQYRFNRRCDLKAVPAQLLHPAVLTRPRPERVIRAAELGRQSENFLNCACNIVSTLRV